MSVTNDYKTITLSRSQSFAVVRGLRARVDELQGHIDACQPGQKQAIEYLRGQRDEAKAMLAALSVTPFHTVQAVA